MDLTNYKLALEINGVKAYVPTSVDKYHTSRIMQLEHLYIYAQAGCTKDVLKIAIDGILERVNSDKPLKTERSDIAIICNSLNYRMQYPVDEMASLRMGFVCAFLEVPQTDVYRDNPAGGEPELIETRTQSEDPNQAQSDYYAKLKEQLCASSPEWHSFFLHLGVIQYGDLLKSYDTSSELDYFRKRREALRGLSLFNSK